MVALNTAYAPIKTLERSQNRVGDFFCEGNDRFGTNRLPTRSRTGENGATVTIIVSGRTRWLSRDPIAENGGINLYAYVGNSPVNYWDPLGLARKPGKTPPKSWPAPSKEVVGKKPKWNPEGYWEGKGRKATWDDRSHGTGQDRGKGPQGGHWDDENSDNRWNPDGSLLPGSEDLKNQCIRDNGSNIGFWTATGMLVAGGALMAADGPLPFGDLIGGPLVGSALLAY